MLRSFTGKKKKRFGAVVVLCLVASLFGALPASAAPARSGDVTAPLNSGTYRMSSAQGPRCLPVINASTWHNGQDMGAAIGDPIYAIAAGVVTRAQPDSTAGQWITVENVLDGQTLTVSYSHVVNARQYVRAGQRVTQGQRIASVGNTGVSTSPHLHLEIWRGAYGGTLLNPETWFRGQGIDLRAGADLVTQVPAPASCTYYAEGQTRIYQSASTSSRVLATVPTRTVMTSRPGASSGSFIEVTVNGVRGWAHGNNVNPARDTYIQRQIRGNHDYTGDGVADVLAVSATGQLLLYPGNARGGFLSTRQVGTGWSAFTILAPGDFNGDRRADLLGIDSGGRMFLYPGRGNGTFSSRIQIGHGWGTFEHLFTIGDFTGDLKPDLIAVDSSGRMFTYPGRGDGRIAARQQIGHGWGIYDRILSGGDISDDGNPDLLAIDSAGRMFAYYANPEGRMNPRQQIGHGWGTLTIVSVGDFNNDTYTDLMGINDSTGAAYLYRGNGKGRIGSAVQIGRGWHTFVQVV